MGNYLENIPKNFVTETKMRIFPLQPEKKVPFPHLLNSENKGGFYIASNDEAVIQEWHDKLPLSNWAVACGKESDIIVIDLDVKSSVNGIRSWADIVEDERQLPDTLVVSTPSGGLHYYFKYTHELKNKISIGKYGGIDIKSEGGYVVIPPSVIEGKKYHILYDFEIAEIPEWLIKKLKGLYENKSIATPKILRKTDEMPQVDLQRARAIGAIIYKKYFAQAIKGQRNKTLFDMLCQMRDNLVPLGIAREFSDKFVTEVNDRDFGMSEGAACVKQAYKYAAREASFDLEQKEITLKSSENEELPVPSTQYEMAEYIAKTDKNIKYTSSRGFLYYDEKEGYWVSEGAEALLTKAIATAISKTTPPGKENKGVFKQDNGNITGIRNLLKSLTSCNYEDFKPLPFLLNTKDNVVDLRDLKTYKHHRDFNFLSKTNASFDLSADKTLPLRILQESLEDPTEYDERIGMSNLTYFLLCLGYCITGETCEEVCFYIWGPPRSGKSLLVNMLFNTLGGFAGHINMSTLQNMNNGNDTQNFQLAGIVDKRVVVSAETDKDTRFDSAKIKSLTGNEPVTCAFKHRDLFTAKKFPKMIFSSNNELDIDVNDAGVLSRFRVFNFPNSHTKNPDTTLKNKLWACKDGFLTLLCEAANFWYAMHSAGSNLYLTTKMAKYIEERTYDLDTVGSFLIARNVVLPNEVDIACNNYTKLYVSELYNDYINFCSNNNMKLPLSLKTFSGTLKAKGFEKIIENRRIMFKIKYGDGCSVIP